MAFHKCYGQRVYSFLFSEDLKADENGSFEFNNVK